MTDKPHPRYVGCRELTDDEFDRLYGGLSPGGAEPVPAGLSFCRARGCDRGRGSIPFIDCSLEKPE